MTNEAVIASWKEKWENDIIPWHMKEKHSLMMKHVELLLNGQSSIQIFFPMCGKCVDMKWFYDQGHSVVGVECSEKAIQDFFAEQQLQFEVEDIERINGKLYRTVDDRLRLFCCDIYKFDAKCSGLMHAVWDRGALVAVEKEDRKRFVQLVLSVLAQGSRCLLASIVYADWFYSGAPRTVPDDLVHFLFEKEFSVTELERDIRDAARILPGLGVDHLEEVVWLLTLKNHA